MPLERLEHYLILTEDLQVTRDFYVDVLGMTDGDRPPFDFPGHWLYLGKEACVHLAERGGNQAQQDYLEGEAQGNGTGPIDHIAFRATGLAEMLENLEARGLSARQRTVPDLNLHQLFVKDPNGVTIELNYPGSENVD